MTNPSRVRPAVGEVREQLDRLAAEFLSAVAARDGTLPSASYEPDWPSPAMDGFTEDGRVYWQPTRRTEPFTFDGLSKALETELPAACAEYFGHFWSAGIPVLWDQRPFELLQLWNSEDENNLMHNLLGHALEKKRVREPLTVFFAVVDDARFLSIDATSGAVMLEEVGGARPEEVAANLGALLAAVTATAGESDSV